METVYDASLNYRAAGTPLVVLAGKEYGSGSSRDWAAKGTMLLGIRAVIAESFERIHRSNLIGMGVLPLQFPQGHSADTLGLSGAESFDITGLDALNHGEIPDTVHVTATSADGKVTQFDADVRIDTQGRATTTSTAESCNTCCVIWRVPDPPSALVHSALQIGPMGRRRALCPLVPAIINNHQMGNPCP